jgi:hypothetical protein
MSEKYDYATFSRAEVEEVFGPKSNSLKAAQMAKFEPQKYAALKQSACYTHGIIAEAMLPRSSQLTREQLDQKAKADAAAQRDEKILLPEEIADRLHLPFGTRMTFAQIQTALGHRAE